jgi:hypothetical protein
MVARVHGDVQGFEADCATPARLRSAATIGRRRAGSSDARGRGG